MKIAFIEPNLHGEFRLNLGLAALMTYISKRTPHKVEFIDLTFHRKDWKKYIFSKLQSFKPEIIGFSCLTFNFDDAIQILSYIKENCPNSYIIFGGIHPTINPLSTIKIKAIDAICIGDGEYVLESVLNNLTQNKTLRGIPGLWFKEEKTLIKNEKGVFIKKLDDLPFIEWEFFEIEKYQIVNPYEIAILGSRGCPFNCSYCMNTVLRNACNGDYVRFRSPENIIKEMHYQLKKLKPYNLRYFYFWDDMFNLKKEFIEKFTSQIIQKRLNRLCTWACSSRVDTIDEERVRNLSRANLNLTRIGVESGNNKIRNEIYFKHFSTKQIIKAISLCKKYKVHIQTDFILGGPTERIENIIETFSLLRIIKPSEISLNIFQPFKGLKATQIFLDDGGTIDENGWRNIKLLFFQTPAKHSRIKMKDLRKITLQMYIYYIFNILIEYFKKQKFRFIYDVLKFSLYLKWKYNFLWHDLFKFTIRKYIYEDNLP